VNQGEKIWMKHQEAKWDACPSLSQDQRAGLSRAIFLPTIFLPASVIWPADYPNFAPLRLCCSIPTRVAKSAKKPMNSQKSSLIVSNRVEEKPAESKTPDPSYPERGSVSRSNLQTAIRLNSPVRVRTVGATNPSIHQSNNPVTNPASRLPHHRTAAARSPNNPMRKPRLTSIRHSSFVILECVATLLLPCCWFCCTLSACLTTM